MFRLRHMKDSDVRGPDNITIKDRMQGTIHVLAKDIEQTGSFCDHYLKKGFLGKSLPVMCYFLIMDFLLSQNPKIAHLPKSTRTIWQPVHRTSTKSRIRVNKT
jgi:hypothetical protein